IGNHFFEVGEAVAEDFQIAHGSLDVFAEPVEIENDGIDGDFFVAKFFDGSLGVLLRMITETTGEISERPSRWQRLTASEQSIMGNQFLPGIGGDDLIRFSS